MELKFMELEFHLKFFKELEFHELEFQNRGILLELLGEMGLLPFWPLYKYFTFMICQTSIII